MRYPPEHKAETRERILSAAARRFREHGFAETPLAGIMRDAELTHGGFYAHFQSKDDLIGEVIRTGFDGVSDRFESRFSSLEGDEWLVAWVNGYLSDEHRAHTAHGCHMPALAPEIARSGPRARAGFTQLFGERLDKVCAHVDAPREEAERRVMAALSQMAGALMLSRAVDEPLASQIRRAAADAAVATLTGRSNGTNHD